jgi:serine O-acetyltransferase
MGADAATSEARRREFREALRGRHPGFREAIAADLSLTLLHRGERHELRSPLDALLQAIRLAWTSDAFLAQVLYRLKTALQRHRIPLLPRLAHRLAIVSGQVAIGDPVVVQPGLYLLHGQVVVDGLTEIGPGTILGPFVTIGLREGELAGPVLERDVRIGTGAKVIGPVRIGAGAKVGANAVVVGDVPPGATVVGAPAREPGDRT